MKQGRTLGDLAREIDRQREVKRDFVVDTRNLLFDVIDETENQRALALRLDGGRGVETFPLRSIAHEQIGSRLKIPKKYYDLMLEEDPELLAYNVNRWFQNKPERRMVRTLDSFTRAFLSNRFRIIDNWDFLNVILQEIDNNRRKTGRDVQVASCEVTESRLHLKIRFPWIQGRINLAPGVGHERLKDGELVESCVDFRNSEVGKGGLSGIPGVYSHRCTNLCLAVKLGQRKFHLGGAQGEEGETTEIFAEDTVQKSNEALMLKIRDMVRAAMDAEWFDEIVNNLQTATSKKITKPIDTTELVAARFSLTKDEHESVLQHLIQGGDLSQYGMMNAITRTAQDSASYDRATELEQIGYDLVTMPTSAWQEVTPN